MTNAICLAIRGFCGYMCLRSRELPDALFLIAVHRKAASKSVTGSDYYLKKH
jgi:hypothetical protein